MDTNLAAPGTTDAAAATRWQAWRDQNDQNLRVPYGWLTLSSLTWLGEDPSPISDFPGQWSHHLTQVKVRFEDPGGIGLVDPNEEAGRAQPAAADLEFPAQDPPVLEHQQARAEVAKRGSGVCVRIRHADSTLRRSFTGTPAWPWQAKWVIPARFEPYPRIAVRDIFTAWDGFINTMEFCGDVVFTLEDVTHRWAVSGTGPDQARVIFTDATSADAAAPWRTTPVVFNVPKQSTQDCLIDFNYAQNFPAHYSAWATCPRPVAENYTGARIEAGHKRPLQSESRWL